MLLKCELLKYEVKKTDTACCVLLKCEVEKKRHCMLRYCVLLTCEVNKKDSTCIATVCS